MTNTSLKKEIFNFAKHLVPSEPLRLALAKPDKDALHRMCFLNVDEKIKIEGGKRITGWYFTYHYVRTINDHGYLAAMHHAVWENHRAELIDVSPHAEQSYPLNLNRNPYFLKDTNAVPKFGEQRIALPMKFFAIGKSSVMIEYVEKLQLKEIEECERIYDLARQQASKRAE